MCHSLLVRVHNGDHALSGIHLYIHASLREGRGEEGDTTCGEVSEGLCVGCPTTHAWWSRVLALLGPCGASSL